MSVSNMLDQLEAAITPGDELEPFQRDLIALARLGLVARAAAPAIAKVSELYSFINADPLTGDEHKVWTEFVLAVADGRLPKALAGSVERDEPTIG